jgi:hypothetical protein
VKVQKGKNSVAIFRSVGAASKQKRPITFLVGNAALFFLLNRKSLPIRHSLFSVPRLTRLGFDIFNFFNPNQVKSQQKLFCSGPHIP